MQSFKPISEALFTFLGGEDLKGKIKRIIRRRGFGFINAEDGQEVFFHRSALEGVDFDALEEDSSLEFDLEKGPKGPRAVNVRKIES